MLFSSQLRSATLIKRYKRFLADVIVDDNQVMTIHCANTGSMSGCSTPGDTIWYSESKNIKRKYSANWELTQTQHDHWICVNTIKANGIVHEAIVQQKIPELIGYETIKKEVLYGEERSRIDLLLENNQNSLCYIEVKSVTLFDNKTNIGYFPDAVTTRGQKHLRELQVIVEKGHRGVIFFLIQHTGIQTFSPAKHIDLKYAEILKQVHESGVEILCYRTHIDTQNIYVTDKIPVIF